MTAITITSFGYLHADPPAAHITIDLRTHFRDPHVAPELRHMTAHAQEVRDAVMSTPGIEPLTRSLATAVRAYLAGPTAGETAVAIGCAGGRHRAATVAGALAALLSVDQDAAALYGFNAPLGVPLPVEVLHRDLHRAVVAR